MLIFDGGTLGPDEVASLRITDHELAGFEFVNPAQARDRLRPDIAERLARALRALHTGTTDYAELHRT